MNKQYQDDMYINRLSVEIPKNPNDTIILTKELKKEIINIEKEDMMDIINVIGLTSYLNKLDELLIPGQPINAIILYNMMELSLKFAIIGINK